jgi:thiamine kinase-like enzyme
MDEQMREIIALVAKLGRNITALTFVLKGRLVAVTPLGGGLTNLNFLLQIDGDRYALRVAGTGSEYLGIDREREKACAESAAKAGVAPAVVHYDKDLRVLVTRFAPGKGLKVEDLRRPDVMQRVVLAVRRMHEQPVTPKHGAFSAFETVRDYHRKARDRHLPGQHPELPADLPGALKSLDRLEKELHTGEPSCLCHNDLLAGNFLDDGKAVQIIDWEYGGAGTASSTWATSPSTMS